MLLRFGLENLWSFRDRVELSFVGTALTDEPARLIPHPATPHGVLPALAVYGGNASGKSNLIKALLFLREELRDSFKRDIGAPIARSPFLLRRAPRESPSRLDVDFTHGDDQFHYGFVFDDRRVIEEWLYLWRGETRRRTLLFHRQGESVDDWTFGAALGGPIRRIATSTRDEVLFFSRAADEKHPRLKGWLEALVASVGAMQVDLSDSTELLFPAAPLLAPENRDCVRRLLRLADLGVDDMRIQDPTNTRTTLVRRLEELGMEHADLNAVSAQLAGMPDAHLVELGHRGEEGVVYLSPDLESVGTKVLLRVLNPVLAALAQGKLLVVDELGGGLHPRLVAELVGLFTDPASNPHHAQILFTTHDSLLMERLRRDEVLLVDKGGDGASTVRALSDLKLRKRDDWRRAYELGLVGGTPTPGRWAEVLSKPGSRA